MTNPETDTVAAYTPYPIVPGHEFSGRVVATGSDVDADFGNQLVAVDPSLFCGACRNCRRGRGNLCEDWNATGVTVGGAFAEYVAVPAGNVHIVTDDVDAASAALIEPLSCAVHALDRLSIRPGDRALLYGAGTMGLLLGQLLGLAGCTDLTVVDTNPERLPRARSLAGATVTSDTDELAGTWDVVVDATGAIAAIEDGLRRVGRGGTFLVFGVADAAASAQVSPFTIYNDEIDILGSMAVLHSFGRAADLVASGAVDVSSLVSTSRPLHEYEAALDQVRNGDGLKVQLNPSTA